MCGTNGTNGSGRITNIDGSSGRCGLHEPVGNNFFFGQLLTPRALTLEQALHTNRLSNISRFVAGTGIVCGLDVTTAVETRPVPDTGDDAEFLRVQVAPGLALDGCGRQLVLGDMVTEYYRTDDAEVADAQDLSVYLLWEKCGSDPVPLVAVENACDERCVDSRFVERGTPEFEFARPDDDTLHKRLPAVDYPSGAEVGSLLLPLSEAPSETLLLERWPSSDLDTSEPVAIAVLGGGDERLYNAHTSDVDLEGGDVLVDEEGNWFVVSDAEARTLPGREPGAEPEALLIALDPSPIGISSIADIVVTGRTTALPGTEVTVSIHKPPGETAPSYVEETLVVDENQTFSSATIQGFRGPVRGPLSVGDRVVVTAEVDGSAVRTRQNKELAEWQPDEVDQPPQDEQAILAGVARSYYENQPLTSCEASDEHRVLLGVVTRTGGSWESTSFVRGPLVYGNDMLYAVAVRHATDFSNPHEVSLSVDQTDEYVEYVAYLDSDDTYDLRQLLLMTGLEPGEAYEVRRVIDGTVQSDAVTTVRASARGDTGFETDTLSTGQFVVTDEDGRPFLFTDGTPTEGPGTTVGEAAFDVLDRLYTAGAVLTTDGLPATAEGVRFESPNRTLSIIPNGQTINIDVAGFEALRRRLRMAETHERRRAIENTHVAYSVVAEKFGETVATFTDEIVRLSDEARRTEAYRDDQAFQTYSARVYDQEQTLLNQITGAGGASGPLATEASRTRYEGVLNRFDAARTGDDISEMVFAQVSVSETAEWLVPISRGARELTCIATEDIPVDAYGELELTYEGFVFATENTDLDSVRISGVEGLRIPTNEPVSVSFTPATFATVSVRTRRGSVLMQVFNEDGDIGEMQSPDDTNEHSFVVNFDGTPFSRFELQGTDEEAVVEICVMPVMG